MTNSISVGNRRQAASGPKLLLLELNEVNFDFVERYIRRGKLPTFACLIKRHGLQQTTSELHYEHLEPWIQWVTAHTGLTFEEHRIFRLGDIVDSNVTQIWEMLEADGFNVGAVSPMNAAHRLARASFFVPDPWTQTQITAPNAVKRLNRAIAQAVSDNAESKLTLRSLADLAIGMLSFALPQNLPTYIKLATNLRQSSWKRPVLLDRLLTDVFIRLLKKRSTDFATLFLNAAAHIQHHYLFSSAVYEGVNRNPTWYVDAAADPILDVYESYDRAVADIMTTFPNTRIMLATALHQVPHKIGTFYWRLRDHKAFLQKARVPFVSVEPRMSRDFLVKCLNAQDALETADRLSAAKIGVTPAFEVDNRGTDVFATLTYMHDIPAVDSMHIGNEHIGELRKQFVFVAIKNGEHDGRGYFIDTGTSQLDKIEFSLKDLPTKVRQALLTSQSCTTADLFSGLKPEIAPQKPPEVG